MRSLLPVQSGKGLRIYVRPHAKCPITLITGRLIYQTRYLICIKNAYIWVMEATEPITIKAARKEGRRNFTDGAAPSIFTAGQMRALGGMNHATAEKLAAAGQFPPPTHATTSAAFWHLENEVVAAWTEACRAVHVEGHYLSHKLPSFPEWMRHGHNAAPKGWPVIRLLSQEELATRAGFDPGRSWVNLRAAGKTPYPSFVARWGYLYVLTPELEAWAEAAAATKGKAWPRVDAVPVFGEGGGQ